MKKKKGRSGRGEASAASTGRSFEENYVKKTQFLPEVPPVLLPSLPFIILISLWCARRPMRPYITYIE